MSDSVLDIERLRAFVAAGSPRARAAGERVAKRRKKAELSQQAVADMAGTTLQTIFRVERGELVPRPYLQHSIAYVLGCEVDDLWQPATRQELFDAGLAEPEAVAS